MLYWGSTNSKKRIERGRDERRKDIGRR